jgi:hypothetical protein
MAQPTLFPESGFRRLRMDIAYDGTNFSDGQRNQEDVLSRNFLKKLSPEFHDAM